MADRSTEFTVAFCPPQITHCTHLETGFLLHLVLTRTPETTKTAFGPSATPGLRASSWRASRALASQAAIQHLTPDNNAVLAYFGGILEADGNGRLIRPSLFRRLNRASTRPTVGLTFAAILILETLHTVHERGGKQVTAGCEWQKARTIWVDAAEVARSVCRNTNHVGYQADLRQGLPLQKTPGPADRGQNF
jgi:hypothetical protein